MVGRPGRELTAAPAAGREGVRPGASPLPTSRPPGRAHGPGRERASAHAPRCLPPREAAARRAGAERGREEVPAGAPHRTGRRAPRPQLGPSWPRWEGWGPPGCPWPDAGPSVGKPCCRDQAPPNPALPPRAFVTCFGQESAPGPSLAAPAGTPVQKPVPGPGRPGAVGVNACTLPSAGWRGVARALLIMLDGEGLLHSTVRSRLLRGSHSEMGGARDLPQKGRRPRFSL